jgi:hypothetical protein
LQAGLGVGVGVAVGTGVGPPGVGAAVGVGLADGVAVGETVGAALGMITDWLTVIPDVQGHQVPARRLWPPTKKLPGPLALLIKPTNPRSSQSSSILFAI